MIINFWGIDSESRSKSPLLGEEDVASGCRYPPTFEPWWTDSVTADWNLILTLIQYACRRYTANTFHYIYIYIYIYHFVDGGGKLCHFKVQLQCNYLARQQGISFKSFKFPFLDPFFVKTKALSRFKTVFHINFSFKIYKIYILSLMS